MADKLSLVIPTYNEKENIEKLVVEIFDEFRNNKIDGEIVIVDDNSPDGTGAVVDNLSIKHKNLRVIHRAGKLGLSSAVLEGFALSKGNILGVMDADFSHPVKKIHEMFSLIHDADIVIGSRYLPGGKIVGWNFKRKLMSRVATILARPFTRAKDPMSGFFMVRKDCLNGISLNSKGFKILLEVLVKANYKTLKEVPIVFVNRKLGKSKASTKEIILYLKNLYGYLFTKNNFVLEFIKFGIVGATGTVLNLAILAIFTEIFKIYYLFSAIIAFIFAVSSNFTLNKIWTFKEPFIHETYEKYLKFFSISLIALAFNLIFLYFFTEIVGIYYLISQAISILLTLIINYVGNKLWTFSR